MGQLTLVEAREDEDVLVADLAQRLERVDGGIADAVVPVAHRVGRRGGGENLVGR